MIQQTITTPTPECKLKLIEGVPQGTLIGFDYSVPEHGGVVVSYEIIRSASDADFDVIEKLVTLFNADVDSNHAIAYTSSANTFEIILDLDYMSYCFVIKSGEDVYQNTNPLGIEYFLPEPFGWAERIHNGVEETKNKPTLDKSYNGWVREERPALQWWNYMLNSMGNLTAYLYNQAPDWKLMMMELLGTNPIGSIIEYASFERANDSWSLCDGRTLVIDNYPKLFNVIGNSFTYDRDSLDPTLFRVPDLVGLVTVGGGQSSNKRGVNDPYFGMHNYTTVGELGGRDQHKLIADELPEHIHRIQTSEGNLTDGTDIANTTLTGNYRETTSLNNTTNENPHENRQSFVALPKFIRIK